MSALAVSNVALWIIVLALLLVVLALTRQLGVLHERLGPAGALMLSRGLAVGEQAPPIEVAYLEGRPLRIGVPRSDGLSTLMTYQVSRLPFAALLDAAGTLRARGLVNSREHLESLFEAQRSGVASLQEYFSK
jgi:hypothetical protein